jgi:hypothetical protein
MAEPATSPIRMYTGYSDLFQGSASPGIFFVSLNLARAIGPVFPIRRQLRQLRSNNGSESLWEVGGTAARSIPVRTAITQITRILITG